MMSHRALERIVVKAEVGPPIVRGVHSFAAYWAVP